MSRIKNLREEALAMHKDNLGKIEVRVKVPVRDTDDLTLAYSPGVAEPCMEINKNPDMLDVYTNHSNFVCVVSNGTAVLGLGDIGPAAAMPVMEGKSLLFKTFGDVDAFPICVNTKDTQKIIEMIELMAPTFGGVNLEDIKAPECFIIEDGLKERGIFKGAIFHDDQHGTAVVTLAGLINALKVVGKKLEDVKVVTSGAGAAGIAIIKLLMAVGLKNVIMCDSKGAIWEGRPEGMNPYKDEIAKRTNPGKVKGGLAEAIKGADVFIGVAAVADWRIATAVSGKMKKTDGRPPELRFEENPDILRTVGTRSDVKLKVGFAAEAENLEAYARGKCISKHADLIVGNLARTAIGSPDNCVLLVTPESAEAFGPASKREVALKIVSRIASMLNSQTSLIQNHAD